MNFLSELIPAFYAKTEDLISMSVNSDMPYTADQVEAALFAFINSTITMISSLEFERLFRRRESNNEKGV